MPLVVDDTTATLSARTLDTASRSLRHSTCATHLAAFLDERGATKFTVPRVADLVALPALTKRLMDYVVAPTVELAGMTFDQHDLLDRQLTRLVLVMSVNPIDPPGKTQISR